MLYFHRIGVSEGIDVNKTSASENFAILNIKGSDYHCVISLIS